MKRIELTGMTFGDLKVLSYLGNKHWECECSCGKHISVFTGSLIHNGKVNCGGQTHLTLEEQAKKLKYNLTGQTFGEWKVLRYLGSQMWECECSCGQKRSISSQHLRYGQTKSCGHDTTKFKDLTGKQFGDWTANKYLGYQMWECKCSCGLVRPVRTADLTSGRSRSCGHNTNSFKDLTGQKIGDWKVQYYAGAGMYWCECSCGKQEFVSGKSLRAGMTKSCGHKTDNIIDLTNKQFWDWTALKYVGDHNWLCRCTCGTEREIPSLRLRSGATKSCGCKKYENYINTISSKYNIKNIKNISQIHLTQAQLDRASSKESLVNTIQDNFSYSPTPKELSKLLGVTPCQVMRIVRNFGVEDLIDLNKAVSSYEDELNELFPCKHRSDRTVLNGQELDLYYPEQNIAIEFNGSYWHSSEKKDKYYHQKKTILAGKRGIHLIHIFEYEWLDTIQKEKIINLIKFHLDKSNIVTIGARKCKIQPINPTESQEFLDKYHLQNSTPASIHIGCYYDSELIGVMTFGTPRFDRTYEYELIRLCWKPNIAVIGGKEKLFKYFINMYNPKSIVSYCNISKFNGNSYLKLGFTFDSISSPNYVWVNPQTNDVLTRYQTMKHKLIEKGIGYINETETEIMERLGYYKIYDCGNMKFTWRNT